MIGVFITGLLLAINFSIYVYTRDPFNGNMTILSAMSFFFCMLLEAIRGAR